MPNKRILFIINPISGDGKNLKLPPIIEKVIDPNQFDIEFAFTEYKGHAKELAANAKSAVDIICAVGGDGSIHEVGTQLINSSCKLAILPTGSGNGIARHLGIPLSNNKALELINRQNTQQIDIGKVNDHYFIGVAGVGFDAYIAKKFDTYHKRGFWSYVKLVVKTFHRYEPIEIKWGSEKEKKGDFFMCCILNSGQFGSGFKLSPHASMTDGKLTLLLIKKPNLFAGLPLVIRAYFGDLRKSSYSTAIEIENINLEVSEELFHLDGEPIELRDQLVEISIIKKGLEIIV